MRFGDVNNQERDLVSVLFVELVEGRNLPPEGRSSVTAEYKHDGPALFGKPGEPNALTFVQLEQCEVWSGISGMESARTGVGPQRFEWKKQENHRAGHFGHHAPKRIGSLKHGPPNVRPKREVGDHQTD
jgi:hypothetical protein